MRGGSGDRRLKELSVGGGVQGQETVGELWEGTQGQETRELWEADGPQEDVCV